MLPPRITNASPPTPTAPFGPLRQHIPQLRIVLVLVHVVYAYMSVSVIPNHPVSKRYFMKERTVNSHMDFFPLFLFPPSPKKKRVNSPLKIIRPRILVFTIWTKRTHVAGRLMHKAMANHFVFALEAFAAFATGAFLDRTVVGAVLGVDIGVGAGCAIDWLVFFFAMATSWYV